MTDYYEDNAQTFFSSTIDVDMSPLYEKFLRLVPDGGHILDSGCGSGRDTKHFLESGYKTTAFDASQKLCELASKHIGQRVHCTRFNEITWQTNFDAVWACASLLHLPEELLPDAMQRLVASLKANGVMYCSFKLGDSERQENGRHFTDMNNERFGALVGQTDHAEIIDIWITQDRRPGRENEKWLNAMLRRI